LWQTGNDPPPADVASAPVDVAVGFESPRVEEVIAPGFALIVVAAPLIVVRTGVIVATGLPLASTETQVSRGDSVTGKMLDIGLSSSFRRQLPALGAMGLADTMLLRRKTRAARAMKLCILDASIACPLFHQPALGD
jgi:hypothetical protein